MGPLLLLLLLGVDAAPPDINSCQQHADCVVASWPGCCPGCCAPLPRGFARKTLAQQQAACTAVRCDDPNCGAVACKPTLPLEEYVARCQAGTCVAVHEPPPRCVDDTQCRLVQDPTPRACENSPCGCCPNTAWLALHVSQPLPKAPPPNPRPPRPKRAEHPDAPQVNCSPCPAVPTARAACIQSRCQVQLEWTR